MSGPIERYLDELRRMLPRLGRERVLAEAEDHLREAAQAVGEEEAVARFGPAGEIARRLAPLALSGWALASAAGALLLLLSVPLAYPVYENNLPPAPWPSADDIPGHLAWKRLALAPLAVIALGAAVVTVLWGRRGVAVAPLLVAAAALAAIGVLAAILSVEWAAAVPGTPAWLVAFALAHAALFVAAAALAGRTALAGHAVARAR